MDNKGIIIGLSHKRCRGKDTTADYLCYRYNFHKVAFADALKEAARTIFGLSQEQLYGELKQSRDPFWNRTPRELLQLLGTEAGRNIFGDDIWIKALYRKISAHPERSFVIPDARFLNEVEAIKSWGGYCIRIDRNIPFDPLIDNHPSETELDGYEDWDYTIDNNGTIQDLTSHVDYILEQINYWDPQGVRHPIRFEVPTHNV